MALSHLHAAQHGPELLGPLSAEVAEAAAAQRQLGARAPVGHHGGRRVGVAPAEEGPRHLSDKHLKLESHQGPLKTTKNPSKTIKKPFKPFKNP